MEIQAAEKGNTLDPSKIKHKLKRFPLKVKGPFVQERVSTAQKVKEQEQDDYLRPVQEEEESIAAMKVLEHSEIERDANTNMNLAKAYRNKLAEANEHMMNIIYKQTKHLQNVIKVLDFQQEQQKDPNNHLAFKDYFELKEIMIK